MGLRINDGGRRKRERGAVERLALSDPENRSPSSSAFRRASVGPRRCKSRSRRLSVGTNAGTPFRSVAVDCDPFPFRAVTPAFWAWDASKASVRTREATKKYVKEAFITPAQAAFRDLKSCREECYFLELLKAHEIPAVNVSQER